MLETATILMIMSWIILLSFGGAFIVRDKTAFQSPHRLFTTALLIRGGLYLLSAIYVIYNYTHYGSDEINGVLSVRKLISAFIFYVIFCAIPISVVYKNNISLRRITTLFTPAAVVSLGYFAICSSLGEPPFRKYATLIAIWCDIANPVVIGRIVVLIVLSAYVIYMLYYIWQLEPIYTRYIKQTQSNERFNLSWMKIYIVCITAVYFSNVSIILFVSPFSIPLYLLIASVSYAVMIYYVSSCHSFAPLDGLKVRFELLKPIVEIEDYDKGKRRKAEAQFALAEEWLNECRPYTKSDFSLQDVLVRFPTIRSNDINEILQDRGFKFQSYIRECRINYAVKLMAKSEGELRIKELSYIVGFDSPASFSRAFRVVKGVSPRDFVKEQR